VSAAVPSVTVASVNLPVAEHMKVLSVVLHRWLTFEKHATAVVKSCHYHAIRHVRHLLSTDSAQTLACSPILSRIDYCNALLHGTPAAMIRKLQQVQNNAARIVLQAPRWSDAKPLLHRLHWLMAISRAKDHLQDGRADIQGLENRNTIDTIWPYQLFTYLLSDRWSEAIIISPNLPGLSVWSSDSLNRNHRSLPACYIF